MKPNIGFQKKKKMKLTLELSSRKSTAKIKAFEVNTNTVVNQNFRVTLKQSTNSVHKIKPPYYHKTIR